MIEDKEIGLKVAESPEEALWFKVRREAELLIKQSKENLILQKAIKEMAEGKLKNIKKKK